MLKIHLHWVIFIWWNGSKNPISIVLKDLKISPASYFLNLQLFANYMRTSHSLIISSMHHYLILYRSARRLIGTKYRSGWLFMQRLLSARVQELITFVQSTVALANPLIWQSYRKCIRLIHCDGGKSFWNPDDKITKVVLQL